MHGETKVQSVSLESLDRISKIVASLEQEAQCELIPVIVPQITQRRDALGMACLLSFCSGVLALCIVGALFPWHPWLDSVSGIVELGIAGALVGGLLLTPILMRLHHLLVSEHLIELRMRSEVLAAFLRHNGPLATSRRGILVLFALQERRFGLFADEGFGPFTNQDWQELHSSIRKEMRKAPVVSMDQALERALLQVASFIKIHKPWGQSGEFLGQLPDSVRVQGAPEKRSP